jgi:pilus assembly protein CpaC
MNNLVLLTGTVANPDDVAEAQRLTQAYVGTDTQVVTRLKSALEI